MKALLYIIIIILFLANLFQVYTNVKVQNQLHLKTTYSQQHSIDSSRLSDQRPFFVEEFVLQNRKLSRNLNDYKFIGLPEKSEILFNDSKKVVLFLNRLSCSECSINKIRVILNLFKKTNLNDFIILSNFERTKEFYYFTSEMGLDNYVVINSDIELESVPSQTILLFYLKDGTIHYPIVVSAENNSILEPYLYFLKNISL